MNPTDWLVILAGVAAVLWVNWYFFLAQRAAVAAVATPATAALDSGAAAPSVTITVSGGYDPAVIRVPAGRPVRLIFDREETAGCSEEVVFPDFGIRRFLPAFERTTVEVTPPAPGTYPFTCGMSMLRGSLIAE